jgi:DnaJ-class molecular chaperone
MKTSRQPVHGSACAETLYDVLGVAESATSKEIKAAYRQKAMKLHPDINKAPDAKERFMECKTAYDTLMDEKQRKAYDRSRKGGFAGSGLGSDFGADWDAFGRYARCAAPSHIHMRRLGYALPGNVRIQSSDSCAP